MACPLKFVRWLLAAAASVPGGLGAQAPPPGPGADSVSVRLVDAELRSAIQALGRHLDRPIVVGELGGGRITLETPRPVPRTEIVGLLRGVLDAHGLVLLEEGGVYRVRAVNGARHPDYPPGRHHVAVDGGLDLFVIRLRHARAADVAATVNALYGRAGALGELGAPLPTLADELRQSRVPSFEQPESLAQAGFGRPAALAGDVTIVPDTRTNSLLVRASGPDFELVRTAVEQLDTRPLQVLIEVLIAEVRRDRGFSLGVETTLPEQPMPGSRGNTILDGSTTGLGLGDFVLRVMRIGGVDLDVTLRAAAARGDVSILSRPVLLAANNERAQIMVGSQRPFVQVQRALPTDAPLRDQVVQYKDVGTQLTVRPTISLDGYVMLEVTQEVNAATTETAFDAPVISTRSVQTQLLVRDGHTAVLGGLADRQRDVSRAGVPVLSDLPLIGWLFGRASHRTTETELFLFLTPRVVRDDAEMDAVREDVRDSAPRVRGAIIKMMDRSAARGTAAAGDPADPKQEDRP